MMMRTTALLSGLLLLGTTACTATDEDPAAGPSATPGPASAPASPSAQGSAAASPAPECVAGRWRVSRVDSSGGFGSAGGTISGGSGATMNVDSDGLTEVDFSGSRPLDFSAQVAGADVRGQVVYHGSMRGAVAFGPADAAGTGEWNPQGDINVADLRGTVKLTEPISVTLLDDADISSFTPGQQTQAGGAVDLQPVLRGGTYTCTGDGLKVETRQNGPTIVWTFTR